MSNARGIIVCIQELLDREDLNDKQVEELICSFVRNHPQRLVTGVLLVVRVRPFFPLSREAVIEGTVLGEQVRINNRLTLPS